MERRRINQSKKTKKGKAMVALRLWSLTTPRPLRHIFHLATSTTTTTTSSTRLILRCSSTATSTTEGHYHWSSSSTSDRDVIHTIHSKNVIKSNSLSPFHKILFFSIFFLIHWLILILCYWIVNSMVHTLTH